MRQHVDPMSRAPVIERSKPDRRRTELAETIEAEIIPRLMLTHRLFETGLSELGGISEFGDVGAAGSVEDFAALVMLPDTRLARAHVETLCRLGVPVETVYLELLAPTARYLGRLWEDDLCDFADVTVGLGALQQVLRHFGTEFRRHAEKPTSQRRILLLPAPGEQHTFGLFMVEEFFRREGWYTRSEPSTDVARCVEQVRTEWFDVVGFSLSCNDLLDELASVIRAVRQAAMNRNVRVLVGGNVFLQNPDLVTAVGADASAADGLGAARSTEVFFENRVST